MSNHQNKLWRYLKGNKVNPSHGLANTIAELNLTSMDYQGELFCWLSDLPHTIPFEAGKTLYACAHAWVDNRMFEADVLSKAQKELAMYGPCGPDGRIEWWNHPEWVDKFDAIYPIVGHYHYFSVMPKFAIIDDDNRLDCLLPEDGGLIWANKTPTEETDVCSEG